MADETDAIVKRRGIWTLRALQMLREPHTAHYARQAVPRRVHEVCIVSPQIVARPGIRVTMRCQRIRGTSLFEMIWEPCSQELALDMAMIALEALARADLNAKSAGAFNQAYRALDFALFGAVYHAVRSLKVDLTERYGAAILSAEQYKELKRVVSAYAQRRVGEKRVLVHGDLHAGNLIADAKSKTLGLVDLEMVHIGRPTTNFAQLWVSFRLADPLLGQKLYQRYVHGLPEMMDDYFDSDVRAEVALRCYGLVVEARKKGAALLVGTALSLLKSVLSGASFESVCNDWLGER